MKEKSLTINSIYYLFYNIANVIFPFVTGIYITHILFPDTIGQVEYARNLVQYFVILSFLGIPTYGMREISKNRKDKNDLSKIYSELLCINFISTCIFGIIYLILIFNISMYKENIVLYLVTGISIFLNFFNISWLYEGLEDFKFISIRNVIFKIFSFILLLIFVKNDSDYLWYAFITVFGIAGNYLLNIINARNKVKFSLKNINLNRHFKPILYLVMVNLAIEIYSLIDITMLGLFCEKSNVAFYSYGSKIYRILLQIINTFTMVLVPKISLYYKEGRINDFNLVVSKTLKVICLLALPIILGIWFVANYVITKIYGNVYINSAYVLKILSFILIISPIGYLLGSRMLLVTGNEKKMVYAVFSGAIVNVILNYILIQKYSEMGAAVASVISESVVMIVYVLLGKNYYKLLNMPDTLRKEFVALILMFLYLIITIKLPINSLLFVTLLQIIGSIIIYFVTLIILKENVIYDYYIRFTHRYIRKNRGEC